MFVKARFLAVLIGQIMSMHTGMGSVVRRYTRNMYQCIMYKAGWDSPVPVDAEARAEVEFWRDNARALNGQYLVESRNCTQTVYSDASEAGYGGFAVGIAGSKVIGTWSTVESGKSSTWRELEALNRVCKSLVPFLKGQAVKCCTDNKSVVQIFQNGSRRSYLNRLSLDLHTFCDANTMSLNPVWIPRENNMSADFLSRCNDSDDWQVIENVFQSLDVIWGPHNIDRFASHLNKKLENFNSRWWCPGTKGVDALLQEWGFDNNWLVPPPRLAVNVIRKLKQEGARCTLLVQHWESAAFWPLLFRDYLPQEGVVDFKILGAKDVVSEGKSNNGLISKNPLPFSMIAVRLRFINK